MGLHRVKEDGPADEDRDESGKWTSGGLSSPAFKKWFGVSKVVTEKGSPIIVYHGTTDLDAFERKDAEFSLTPLRAHRTDFGNFGIGVYMTPQEFIAKAYSRTKAGAGYTGTTVPLYARIEKPLKIEVSGPQYTDGSGQGREATWRGRLRLNGAAVVSITGNLQSSLDRRR